MNLNIQNYEILNFSNDDLLVSKKGISKINSTSLLAVLNKLQSYPRISKDELNNLLSGHGLNPEAAYKFLEKTLSIREGEDDLYFEKTIVAHDWTESAELEKLLRSEIDTPLEMSDISSAMFNSVAGKRCYVVILSANYDYNSLKKLYFSLVDASPESAISIGHRAGGSYCISQPYLPKVGNPCHFCSIDRLINYEGHRESRNNWSKLLQFCRGKHISVPENSLNLLQRSLVLGVLIKKIKLLSCPDSDYRYQDNILQETHVDLNGLFVREVSTSHWYMCDCLRLQK